MVVDMSTPSPGEDFAFTVAGITPQPRQIVGHHTIEPVIFTTALARVLSQRPRAALQQLQNVAYAVMALADDAAPVQRGERAWREPDVLTVPAADERPRIVLDEGRDAWSVRANQSGLWFELRDDDSVGFSWPTDALWKLLSALTWRTHCVDHGRALSRVPTEIYVDTVAAVSADLEPAAAAEPRSPDEAAEEARYAALSDWYANASTPVAGTGKVLRDEDAASYGRTLIAGTLRPNDLRLRLLTT
ncbi:hypothetical protein [Flexivirga meconopsidis]|uniref:hypothetical protein n=1 Tax=Flexivirga meconopsidis TaxID=2977121 RepID=UPI002240AF33|nr:hypothetical protein [Flexivirga meconopsidis]